MNLGLTTSFIIAGILLLSILSMNMNVSQSSTTLTMRNMTQQRVGTIAEVLEKDISNIAYSQGGPYDDPITDAREGLIEFKTDINDDGTQDVIQWKHDASNNRLIRTLNGDETTFNWSITDFNMAYLDNNRDIIDISTISKLEGNDQSKRNNIRFIDISMTVRSPEQVGGMGSSDPEYIKTNWNREFRPINLSL